MTDEPTTLVTLEAIREAQRALPPQIVRTPLLVSEDMGEDLPDVDTVLVPVSSGGLIAGVATAVKALRPSARVIGVQPAGSHAVHTSFERGEVTRIDEVQTICDALIAAHPGKLPFAH